MPRPSGCLALWSALGLTLAACGAGAPRASAPAGGGRDAGAPAASGSPAGIVDSGVPDGSARVSYVYVASATEGRIYGFALDAAAVRLAPRGAADAGSGTSFLALDGQHRRVYAANEAGSDLSSFTVDPATGDLQFLNRIPAQGKSPAFISLDRTGQYLLGANYDGANVVAFPIVDSGELALPFFHPATGALPHFIQTDPSNRFAFVACLGADFVAQFQFDADGGTLTPNPVPQVNTAAQAGPRHLDFHPNGRLVYLVNETSSTVTSFSLDLQSGQLSPLQTLSVRPPGFTGVNTGAELHVHPSGKFLYVSNRGSDTLAQLALAEDGTMRAVSWTPSGGRTPRHFSLTADGALLLVANQGSGNVVGFRVDPVTGTLTSVGPLAQVAGAEYVGVLDVQR